jgi:OTU domain-containing protein 6
MEKELVDRQAEELAKLKIDENDPEDNSEEQSDVKSQDDDAAARKSKAQRRRERKEQEAKKREIEILQGEEENKTSVRQLEVKAINKILKSRLLTLSIIKSDGDCLYNSIRHQLELHNMVYSVDTLRKIAADYIRANKDELICYMPSSKGDDIMSQEEFDDYCNQVENTKAWGSQIEIQALSNALKLKIEVLQAQGTSILQGADFPNAPHLIVTYHRHFYGLGEHYNSTVSTKPLNSNNAAEN